MVFRMRAGRLRDTIYIQTPTETTSGGITTATWAVTETLRAETDPIRGAEMFAASQVQDTATKIFKVRYTDGITQKARIVFGEHAYNIIDVKDVSNRHRELLIMASIYPQEYEQFALSAISRTGTLPGSITFTWTSEMPSTSRVRYRESTIETWTTGTHTTTKVLSHSVTVTGFKASTSYYYGVYSENANAWSPGWSTSGTFSMNADNIMVT